MDKSSGDALDASGTVERYLQQTDWRSRENSNLGYSFSSVFLNLAGEVMERYTLSRVYSPEVAEAHRSGDFHIHNLSMGIIGYCAGWSIEDILTQGFNGIPARTESSPPRHLSTALLQLANFLGTLQNEWAGAQSFNSLDTYLAPYVRVDGLGYGRVKQEVQQFIYNLNIASRWGGQTPFTNVTFDLKPPPDLAEAPAVHAGGTLGAAYGDFQPEMDMLNRAFCEVMEEGDMRQRVFTFPIPTYNVTRDFDWEGEVADAIFRMTAKYGSPYFQNFINSDLDPDEVRAMCCRLRLDLREIYRRVGGTFGYADKTGSVGVVTINMPRIAYLAEDEDAYFERLGGLMELARTSLETKRRVVAENMERGLLPFSKRYLGTLKWHFSTIGLVGMNEACLNLLGEDIGTPGGKGLAVKTLRYMRERAAEFQRETGHIYNVEATPAEGASHRLARLDRERYPDIVAAGEEAPYYTNSTHLPVNYTDDLYAALEHQEELQILYTGGTVFHVFLGERIQEPEGCRLLVRRIAERFRIPYYTITPTFSICQDHGYLAGEHFSCPACGRPAEVYSRVVGYYRPVQNWHRGKQEEYRQRRAYAVG
ncbi:ribonucleoside-triphosphate reductase [miscellaneous Crenarchaeota group-15 archaeon DG-45]|uniref:Ribonucleoside-triphosphate reductase n=1 Tax=miscellaneous Crenarchaeota group-15 archaeon DG-45 TaxID=1685127 RepID=A0A0M0BQ38_9ARCH|nr:MAG: ribonucleoside-triphosphate reductase [miscellaneous Crenarchaeota group-15 archaeon DG-45]